MCFEPINEAAARACKERDALRKKAAEQEKEILSLKEELQQARSILTEKYEETLELLEAAKSAQGLLQIHLVKVQDGRDELKAAYDGAKIGMKALNEKLVQVTAERDALKKIVAGGIDACSYCEHEMEGLCGNTYECVECVERCVCGKCEGGSMFEYRGVEDKT